MSGDPPPPDVRRQALIDLLREATGQAVPTTTFGRFRRLAGAAASAAWASRRGSSEATGIGAMDPADIERLVVSLGELKGIAMKMGQILSYIDVKLPPETQRLLALLQSWSQPTAFETIATTLREDLGAEAEAILATLDPAPVASASIGQVHRARRPDGEAVAVKVRHPGIDEAIRADFRAASLGKAMSGLLFPGSNVKEAIDEARTRFLEECDYRLEASRQRRFSRLCAGHPLIDVPAVHDAWSAARVLTTTWHAGVGLEAFLAGGASEAERTARGLGLYDFYVGTLYRHGVFNADPHPGNLVFQPDGRLAILDYGCVREFEPDTVAALGALSRAVRDDDAGRMRDALVELGAHDPGAGKRFETTRGLLRGFYGPVLEAGARQVEAGASLAMGDAFRTKRAIFRLRLPGKLLFLFRIRFGLYAVLARLGAVADWRAVESALTEPGLSSPPSPPCALQG